MTPTPATALRRQSRARKAPRPPRPAPEPYRFPWWRWPGPPTFDDVCDALAFQYFLLDELLRSVRSAGWRAPTRLAGWRVADLLGHAITNAEHVFRMAHTPPSGDGSPIQDALDWYQGSGLFSSLIAEQARSVASSGSRARARLPELAGLHEVAASTAAAILRSGDPGLVLGGAASDITLADYTVTRLVEAVVHGLDLADALDRPGRAYGPAVRLVSGYFAALGERRGGGAIPRAAQITLAADGALVALHPRQPASVVPAISWIEAATGRRTPCCRTPTSGSPTCCRWSREPRRAGKEPRLEACFVTHHPPGTAEHAGTGSPRGGGFHLALEVDGDGAHPAAWRHSGRPPGAVLTPAAVRKVVAEAERAGFALVTFDDGPLPPNVGRPDREAGSQTDREADRQTDRQTDREPGSGAGPDAAGRIEAGTRAAYVSVVTDRVGLAPTLHVTTTEPFHLATQLASLDHTSKGRAAWVVGAANSEDALATVGGLPRTADALRRETADVVAVARALWDSWQDDAVIKDVATGRYLDVDRVHPIDFQGGDFTVKGPLITPRPPQGQVVVLAADALELDAEVDVVLVGHPDPFGIAARAKAARDAGAPLVFAEIEVVLDADVPAEDRLAALEAASHWPETGRLRHVGPAAELTELLIGLAEVVDGVRLHPAVLAVDLPVLTAEVLPALAAARLHRAPEPDRTLRDTLGLARPANRFAAAATTDAVRTAI
ncbi:hypothetical protein GCM10009839_01200 [Catenulispora yoronensis]|uniref:Uncharacterized protein n=1 Tax=Catenulispora yoronensis TaxID=450799 RepID=A0ABN2TIZ0_9ACTN